MSGLTVQASRQVRTKRPLAALLLVCLLGWPAPVGSWDETGHRLIVSRAVVALPFPLRAYFGRNERSLQRFVNDPSLWGDHTLARETRFIHLDEYGSYPFAELPRDRIAAVRKFRRSTINNRGTLPWTIGTYSLQLEEAFREERWDDVKLYSSILAFYVAEAHDPFNTTSNANVEASGQGGVAERYTRTLVNRYRMFLIVRPSGAYKINDPTAQAFGMVLEANTWVDNILLSDAQASSGKDDEFGEKYGAEYFDDFYGAVGAVLMRQLNSASTDVASYWYTAWVNAGRPPLPAR